MDDHTSLDYECLPLTDGKLKCEFIQTSIEQSPGRAENERIAELMRKRLEAGEAPIEERDCEAPAEIGAKLDDPEFKAEMDRLPESKREEGQAFLHEMLEAWGALCENRTRRRSIG